VALALHLEVAQKFRQPDTPYRRGRASGWIKI